MFAYRQPNCTVPAQALGFWMLWFTILTLMAPAIAACFKVGGDSEKGGSILLGCVGCFESVVIIFYIINWVRADSNSQTRLHARANVMSTI